MKILVLGGTGAMGTPLVEILADRNNDVYVTTRSKREASGKNVNYITGNAHENDFISSLLKQKFDVVIDFMSYTSQEFEERMDLFLNSTNQYIFFSSARVYADNEGKLITEASPRLLDAVNDSVYLQTDEYALAKAKEENLLQNSGKNNWTVIRPYITYNDDRLQLGVLEKEMWLRRALIGKSIVFCRDIADKYTTLTYGYDVALRIADIAGKSSAMGEIFHITTSQSIKWSEVLEIYLDVLTEKLNARPDVYWVDSFLTFSEKCFSEYQIKYDRLFDRRFDNSKIESEVHTGNYTSVSDGLRKCVGNFVEKNTKNFGTVNWRTEGVFDRLTGEKSRIKNIAGWKNKVKYILYRYIIKYRFLNNWRCLCYSIKHI